MTRQQANRKILSKLSFLVESLPDQRFVQLLDNANVIIREVTPEGILYQNDYNTESIVTLKRLLESQIWEIT